jgi:hypothetical protein
MFGLLRDPLSSGSPAAAEVVELDKPQTVQQGNNVSDI